MRRLFDHIDLRVNDLARAAPFYRALLPLLGFTRPDIEADTRWIQYLGTGDGVSTDRIANASTSSAAVEVAEFFGLTEDRDHVPNKTRIAFRADSPAAIDALAPRLAEIGARNIEGPDSEAPHYYAVYFEDPFGNRFEVCHRTRD